MSSEKDAEKKLLIANLENCDEVCFELENGASLLMTRVEWSRAIMSGDNSRLKVYFSPLVRG